MQIRAATNADIAQIQAVVFGVLAEYGLSPDPSSTDADLTDIETNYINAGGVFDVVEMDGEIIGTAGLYPLKDGVCELRKMYLLKAARGKGVGKQLMDRLLTRARELGFHRIELETASVLQEAIALYTRYGFKPYQPDHLAARCDQAYALDLTE